MASRVLLLSAFGVLLSLSICSAQEEDEVVLTEEHAQKLHHRMDKNSDGKLSMEEILEHHKLVESDNARRMSKEELFTSEIDTDGDGKLSLAEILALQGLHEDTEDEQQKIWLKREPEKFKVADADGDGLLTPEEALGQFYPHIHPGALDLTVQHLMADKDLDGDGELTVDEFFETTDGSTKHQDEELTLFNKLDKDKNGKLSKDEVKVLESYEYYVQEAANQLFERYDDDGDKHISAKEFGLTAQQTMDGTGELEGHLLQWVDHMKHSEL